MEMDMKKWVWCNKPALENKYCYKGLNYGTIKVGLGDMAQKIITIIIFISVDIDNYHDKCSIFISFRFWRINIISNIFRTFHIVLEENYIAIIIVIELSPSPTLKSAWHVIHILGRIMHN